MTDEVPLPPWHSGKGNRKTNNRKSGKYERDLARETGGKTSAGSGSSWRAPEDVRTDTHLIQHKFTSKSSYSLRVDELERIFHNARQTGREGALIIDFEASGLRITVTEG